MINQKYMQWINCHFHTHIEKRYMEWPRTEGADQKIPTGVHTYIAWVGFWKMKNKKQQQSHVWRQRDDEMEESNQGSCSYSLSYLDHKPFPNTQSNFYCRRLIAFPLSFQSQHVSYSSFNYICSTAILLLHLPSFIGDKHNSFNLSSWVIFYWAFIILGALLWIFKIVLHSVVFFLKCLAPNLQYCSNKAKLMSSRAK